MYVAEKDSNMRAFISHARIYYYWRSVFKIRTVSWNSKYFKLLPLIKVFLAFWNGDSAVERSLSDNKNCVTSEKVKLFPGIKVCLRRMKEYSQKHVGTHSINIIEEMVSSAKKAGKLNAQQQREEEENTRNCTEQK